LKELVRKTQDIECAVRQGVPRSTARGWLTNPGTKVVTIDIVNMDVIRLQREVLLLRRRVRKLTALLRVLLAVTKISGYSLSQARLPEGKDKKSLLQAIDRGRSILPLRSILRVIRLSPSRYHNWNRKEQCELDDVSSCPQVSPHQLTTDEVDVIHELVTSDEYRHVPTGTLAILAQRLGMVFASVTTWYRLVRERQWRRPRGRVHPAKPEVGIRASRPNEIWHVDTTLIRLINGGRAYLHAVIDNYSRRILAWCVADRFQPGITAQLLLDASNAITSGTPTVLVDGGVENYNAAVDNVIDSGVLKRVLAQTEICFSNSLIESWWRVLKHQWLYLNELDSVTTVEKLVASYVDQHNSHLPHSAFRGQTPDEMYFGTGEDIPKQLDEARHAARRSRMAANRSKSCRVCEGVVAVSS